MVHKLTSPYVAKVQKPYLFDLCVKIIKIYEEIDAGLGKRTHAAAMITAGIDVIYTDGIGSQLLHRGCITSALSGVKEWIEGDELVGNPTELLTTAIPNTRRRE